MVAAQMVLYAMAIFVLIIGVIQCVVAKPNERQPLSYAYQAAVLILVAHLIALTH